MKFRSCPIALMFTVLLALPGLAAPSPQPTRAMMRPVNALLRALDSSSAAPVRGMFAQDTVIVDEFAPFVWTGSNAGEGYLASFGTAMKDAQVTNVTGRVNRVIEFQRGGNRAYLALATRITAMHGGKQMVESGTWTFVLEQFGSAWMIRSVTWSTVNPMS